MARDDPEERIRELERGSADQFRVPPRKPPGGTGGHLGAAPGSQWGAAPGGTGGHLGAAPPPYSGSAPPPYSGSAGPLLYRGLGSPPRSRLRFLLLISLVSPAIFVVVALAIVYAASHQLGHGGAGGSGGSGGSGGGANGGGPIAVPHGGELSVGGNSAQTQTISCNDGNLTLTGDESTYTVTGHCASLKVSGYDNQVSVESAATLEASGFGNTFTYPACNNANVNLSFRDNALNAGGHCASITVGYDNHVHVDSADTIKVLSNGNTVEVKGQCGSLTVSDDGFDNQVDVNGHCGSITVANYGNHVKVGSVDAINISSDGNTVEVSGHCGSVTVSGDEPNANQVNVDSVDTVNLSGFSNTVTYHSGSPKVTDSGRDNTVQPG